MTREPQSPARSTQPHTPQQRQTTHVVVDVAGHVFIVSSLSSRTDVVVIAVDAVSGRLSHDGLEGIDVFRSEADALARVDPRGIATRKRVPALLGYIVHGGQGHILAATKVRRLQAHGHHTVYCVESSAWIRCQLQCGDMSGRREGLLVASLRSYPLDGCHYFSETLDLTRPHLPAGDTTPSQGRVCYDDYVWNVHIAAPFVAIGFADCCRPLLHGIVHAGAVQGEGNVTTRYLFLTRRSSRCPYPSAAARGMARDGGVANESECELCFWTSDEYASEARAPGAPDVPSTWVDFRSVVFRKGTAPVPCPDPCAAASTAPPTPPPLTSQSSVPAMVVPTQEANSGATPTDTAAERDCTAALGAHVREILDRFGTQRLAFVSLLRGGGVTSVSLERAVARLRKELRAELALVRYDWELTCSALGGTAGAMEGLWEIALGVCRDMGMFGARMELDRAAPDEGGASSYPGLSSPVFASGRTDQRWTVSIVCENGIGASSLAGLAIACSAAATAVSSLGFVPVRETPSASPSTRRSATVASHPIRAPEGIPIALANALGHGFLYAIAQFLAADADQSSRAYELRGNASLADSLRRMAAGVPQGGHTHGPPQPALTQREGLFGHHVTPAPNATDATGDDTGAPNRAEAVARCEQIDLLLGRRLVELMPSHAHPRGQAPHLISMLPGAFCLDLSPFPLTTSEGLAIPADALLLPPGWGNATASAGAGAMSSLPPWTFYLAPPGCDRVSVTIALAAFAHVTAVALWVRHGECDVTSPQTMDVYLGTHADTLEPVLQDVQLPFCRDGTRIHYSIPSPANTRLADAPALFRFGADHTRRPASRFARIVLRGAPPQAQMTLGAVEVFGVWAPSPVDPLDASSAGHIVASARTVSASRALDDLLERCDSALSAGIPPLRSRSVDSRAFRARGSALVASDAPRATALTVGDPSSMRARLSPSPVDGRPSLSPDATLDDDAAANIEQYARQVSLRLAGGSLGFADALMLERERLRLGVTAAQRAFALAQLGVVEAALDPNRFVCGREDSRGTVTATTGGVTAGAAGMVTSTSTPAPPFGFGTPMSPSPSISGGVASPFQLSQGASPSSAQFARGRTVACAGCRASVPAGAQSVCRYCGRGFCDKCMSPEPCDVLEFGTEKQPVCAACAASILEQRDCVDDIVRRLRATDERDRRREQSTSVPYQCGVSDGCQSLDVGAAHGDPCGSVGRPSLVDAAESLWSLAEHPRAALVHAVNSDLRSPPPECVLLPPDAPSVSGLAWVAPAGTRRAEFVVSLSSRALVRRIEIVAGVYGFRPGSVPTVAVRTGVIATDIVSSSVQRQTPTAAEQMAGVAPYGIVRVSLPGPVTCRLVSLSVELPQDAADVEGCGRLSIGRIRVLGEPIAHTHRTMSLSALESVRADAKPVTRNHVKPLQTSYRHGGRICDLSLDPVQLVGFSVIARHCLGSPTSQVRLVRVTVTGRAGSKGETIERCVGVFVIPLSPQGAHLFYDVEQMGTGSVVTFEALATHGAATMCVPLKVAVYG